MVTTAFAPVTPPRSDPQGLNADQVWQRVLSRLQLSTDDAQFSTYLRRTRGLAYDPGASVIRVAAANPFHVPWLEGRLSSTIHTAVAEVLEAPVRVEFFPIADSTDLEIRPARSIRRPRPAPSQQAPLTSQPDPEPADVPNRSYGPAHAGAGL